MVCMQPGIHPPAHGGACRLVLYTHANPRVQLPVWGCVALCSLVPGTLLLRSCQPWSIVAPVCVVWWCTSPVAGSAGAGWGGLSSALICYFAAGGFHTWKAKKQTHWWQRRRWAVRRWFACLEDGEKVVSWCQWDGAWPVSQSCSLNHHHLPMPERTGAPEPVPPVWWCSRSYAELSRRSSL